jgi:SAM-dependent methyltransferase
MRSEGHGHTIQYASTPSIIEHTVKWTLDQDVLRSLHKVAAFFDARKVGAVGSLGFRRSTDLLSLLGCLKGLVDEGLLIPDYSSFLDLGCADGRVNVLMSYLVKTSVGVELDEWTLEEYEPLKTALLEELARLGLRFPADNIFLFHGDSTDKRIHEDILRKTGLALSQFDLFYTYLVMHEEFARLIADRAKKGALFMVYGLDRILPRYQGLRLLSTPSPPGGIVAVYQKT